MGKQRHSKDRLFITQTEWRTQYGGKREETTSDLRGVLPFDCCALTLAPFETPVCTRDGIVFDLLAIVPHIKKKGTNPVTGAPLTVKELVKLHYHKNAEGLYHCPVTYKVFNKHTHIVAIATSGNVYSYDTVKELNLGTKNMTDLISGEAFTKADIITLQDPANPRVVDMQALEAAKAAAAADVEVTTESQMNLNQATKRVLAQLQESEQAGTSMAAKSVAVMGEARAVPAEASSATGADGKRLSVYTTGAASASFTSSSMTVQTKNERTAITKEEEDLERYQLAKQLRDEKALVRVSTTLGDMIFELHTDIVPRTVENFILLCKKGYYDNVIFHRSIRNFMIQGGDPTGTGRGGESAWGGHFKDEFSGKLTHKARGVIAMANSGPNTNGSQFYITFAPTSHLDNKHAVFGRVIRGLEVLDKMEAVKTNDEKPVTDIKILSTEVLNDPMIEVDRRIAAKQAGTNAASDATVVPSFASSSSSVMAGSGAIPVGHEMNVVDRKAKKPRQAAAGFGNFDAW